MNQLKITRLSKTATLPFRATSGAAGYDLCADVQSDIVIAPHETVKIPIGIAVGIDENYVGLVFPRSGLATNHGIILANCVGVIDSDYRGELFVPLHNNSDESFTVTPKQRIAQLVLTPVATPTLVECLLDDTDRGSNGFGSTQ